MLLAMWEKRSNAMLPSLEKPHLGFIFMDGETSKSPRTLQLALVTYVPECTERLDFDSRRIP